MREYWKRMPRRLTHMFLLVVCNVAAIMVLTSVFRIDMEAKSIAAIIVCAVLAVLMCENFVKILPLAFFGFLGIYLIAFMNELSEGVVWFRNRIDDMFNVYYGKDTVMEELEVEADSIIAVVIFYAAVLSLILALALAANQYYVAWIFVAMLPLLFGLVVNVLPAARITVGFVLTVFLVMVVPSFEKMKGNAPIRYELLLVGLCAGMLCILPAIVREETYQNSVENGKVREFVRKENYNLYEKIEEYLNIRLMDFFGNNGDDDAGVSGGVISHGGIQIKNETVLRVELPANSPQQYLRGYVGGTYQDGVWTEDYDSLAADWEMYDLEGYPYTMADSYTYLIFERMFADGEDSIKAKEPFRFPLYHTEYRIVELQNSKYHFAPYCSDGIGADSEKTNGMMIYNAFSVPNYFTFSNRLWLERNDLKYSSQNVKSLFRFVTDYARLVKHHYLEVPKEYREVLADKVVSNGDIFQKIEYVQNYLTENFTYTMNPPKSDRDEDPVMFFLTESKQGFCQHYASVAVMMLRMMGIPARFAEGYIVPLELIQQAPQKSSAHYYDEQLSKTYSESFLNSYVLVDVTDRYAHAWPEVWIDGYGWYPIEVTSGYVNSADLSMLSDTLSGQPTPTGTVQPTPTPTVSLQPTSTPTLKPSTPTGISQKPSGTPREEKKAESNDEMSGTVLAWLLAGIVMAVLVAFVAVRYLIRKAKRNHAFENKNLNAATLSVYKEIIRIFEAMGAGKEENETDHTYHERLYQEYPDINESVTMAEVGMITERAVFSKDGVTRSDSFRVKRYYVSLRRQYLSSKNALVRAYLVVMRGL